MRGTLIFSKNRVMQLEALLYSMEKFYTLENCTILYYDEFDIYHKLDYPVTMYPQTTDFKEDVLDILDCEEICFLCDDDIFYQNAIVPEKLDIYETFSLRLGRNVTKKKQFDYTISLDGNIFRTEDIRPLIESIEFTNPNQLERGLVKYHKLFTMRWHRQSLVGIPHNRVSKTSKCYFTGKYGVEELTHKFKRGYRIRNLNFDTIITDVHADIDFNLVLGGKNGVSK